jgi:hypothetical protein
VTCPCVCGCSCGHVENCIHGCTLETPDDGQEYGSLSVQTEHYSGKYRGPYRFREEDIA